MEKRNTILKALDNRFGTSKKVLGKCNHEDVVSTYWYYGDKKAAKLEIVLHYLPPISAVFGRSGSGGVDVGIGLDINLGA